MYKSGVLQAVVAMIILPVYSGMAGVSGVGISFGADRIFDVLNQL